ncbi:hypothetical protein ACWFRM_38905 [Streptomyces sp. NPDC055144]
MSAPATRTYVQLPYALTTEQWYQSLEPFSARATDEHVWYDPVTMW